MPLIHLESVFFHYPSSRSGSHSLNPPLSLISPFSLTLVANQGVGGRGGQVAGHAPSSGAFRQPAPVANQRHLAVVFANQRLSPPRIILSLSNRSIKPNINNAIKHVTFLGEPYGLCVFPNFHLLFTYSTLAPAGPCLFRTF